MVKIIMSMDRREEPCLERVLKRDSEIILIYEKIIGRVEI